MMDNIIWNILIEKKHLRKIVGFVSLIKQSIVMQEFCDDAKIKFKIEVIRFY